MANAMTEREATRNRDVSRADVDGGGLSVSRILVLGAAIGLAAFAMKQIPDLRRYLKMRSM
jgi:hypothetical protein